MIKYITILVVAISFALTGCKKPEPPTEGSGSTAGQLDAAKGSSSASANKSVVTAEQLAALEQEKNEAIRLAQLQIQQAKDEQKRKIAEVQARLEIEEAARAVAEKQAADTRARLDTLTKSLADAEKRQAEIAAMSQSANQTREKELAAAAEAVQNAKAEAVQLKKQQDELDGQRLKAIAKQERIEAELRAELDKYKEIENWDYSYAVRPDQYKRQANAIINAKIKANPNNKN